MSAYAVDAPDGWPRDGSGYRFPPDGMTGDGVKRWAVSGNDGEVFDHMSRLEAESDARWCDANYPSHAPHRIWRIGRKGRVSEVAR